MDASANKFYTDSSKNTADWPFQVWQTSASTKREKESTDLYRRYHPDASDETRENRIAGLSTFKPLLEHCKPFSFLITVL